MKKIAVAIAATVMSSLLFANAARAADTVTITFDDADFYAAFKDCALNGPGNEEWTIFMDTPTISEANKEAFRNKCWVENANVIVGFDDATLSVTYPDQDAINSVLHIHLPHYGLKHIEDLKKFPRLDGAKMNNNLIEDIDFNPSETDIIIFLGNNPLRHIPDYYVDKILRADLVDDIVKYLSLTITDIQLEESYDGGSYNLPHLFSQVKLAFDRIQELTAGSDEELQHDFGDDWRYQKAVGEFYKLDKWIHLENAYINRDYTKLIPIDPSKDMVVSFRNTWEETQNSPLLHMCAYMPDIHLLCENGQFTELGASATALEYREAYYSQSSNEYGSIATITVKRSNAPAEEIDGVIIHIDNKKLFDALNYCAQITPSILYDSSFVMEEHLYQDLVLCRGLEYAAFDTAKQDIIFFDEYDLLDVEEIMLDGMGLDDIDELEKFPYLHAVSAARNEIERTNLWKDELFDFNRMRKMVVLINNKLREVPGFYDYMDKLSLTPFAEGTNPDDISDDEADTAFSALYNLLMTRSVIGGEQHIEDYYSGDRYEMLDYIADTQAAFDYLHSFANIQTEDSNDPLSPQRIGNYWQSDTWIRLENAVLGEDRKSLTPIDNTKDMKISYCVDYDKLTTEDPILGHNVAPLDQLEAVFGGDTDACVLRATIKHYVPLPATADDILTHIAILMTSITTLAVSIWAVRH